MCDGTRPLCGVTTVCRHFLAVIRKKSLRHPGCFSDPNEKEGSMKKALSICGLLAVVALPADGGRPLTIMQTQSEAKEIRLSVRVYTEQQATRGRGQYVDHCSACHQPELEGSHL